VTDLVGFELQVDFDSTGVTLESISDDGANELNLLKLRGGIAVSITTPRGDAITQVTRMLGGTASQWGQGDGLLSVMSFTVNERFSGNTDIVVTQAQLSNGAGGTETVQVFTRGTVTVEGLDTELTLTASADSIDSDGVASSTITASLADLDGLALTDDDASEVTFTVAGEGLIDGLSSKTVTVTNGSETASLTAQAEGDIVVTASTSGAREATVTVVGKGLAPLGEGEVGPMSLDFDATAGDQAQRLLDTERRAYQDQHRYPRGDNDIRGFGEYGYADVQRARGCHPSDPVDALFGNDSSRRNTIETYAGPRWFCCPGRNRDYRSSES